MNNLYLNISKPRKDVKKILGQANHFLITILVGLDSVKKNDITLPAEFRTSWNPKDKIRSVLRSREYALISSLAWAVDCLDAYFTKINQSPKLIEDYNLQSKIDESGRSVYEKYNTYSNYIISNNFKKEDFALYKALIDLAIQWRNNTTHYNAENVIQKVNETILIKNTDIIEEKFCGLQIKETLKHFNEEKAPTFKEVTSLIRATQNYIEILDIFLLTRIDIVRYTYDLLNKFFAENTNEKILYPTLTKERRNIKINNILHNWSFSENSTKNSVGLTMEKLKEISDKLIELWAKQ